MNEVTPILLVVLIWAVVFVGTLWFFGRALRVPTEAELEAAHAEGSASSTH